MRLRLSVQRNLLPAVEVLWNVSKNQSPLPQTIANLLERVNEVIPLEYDQWGLEDYVVEVKGFECIHHFLVQDVLKDEDRVVYEVLSFSVN